MTSGQAHPVRRLRSGDTVRLVSPCSPPDRRRLLAGLRMLADWGLRVEIAEPDGIADRPPGERADELQQAMADPAVHAVLVTRAGAGAEQLLPLLDFSVLDRQPKPVCGFSDVTFLHQAIAATVRRPTFHTPELAWNSRLNGARSETSLRTLLTGPGAPLHARDGVVRSRGPAVCGRLRGGNLSTLARIDASATSPGDVLFLEELRETPESIAALLDQITRRGHTDGVGAVVFGQFVECGDAETVSAVLDDWCEHLTATVLAGVQAGHGSEQESLALGWQVVVDPIGRILSYPSSPTSAELTW